MRVIWSYMLAVVNNEVEGVRTETVVAYLRHYPIICVEGMNKTTKVLSP